MIRENQPVWSVAALPPQRVSALRLSPPLREGQKEALLAAQSVDHGIGFAFQ
jgi:hypothetical protein